MESEFRNTPLFCILREAAIKVLFLMARPLRGEGGVRALPLKKITLFETLKSVPQNVVAKLQGGGAGPFKKNNFFAASLSKIPLFALLAVTITI